MEDSNGQERGGCPHIPALMQEENRLQLLASGVSSRLQRPAVERQKEGLGEEESCLKRGGRTKQPVCSPVSSRVPPAAAGHIWKTSVLLVCELLAFQAYLPLGFFFLVVVDSSALPHQLRKLKCNEADNVDCLAADQMSIKPELLTRSLMIKE